MERLKQLVEWFDNTPFEDMPQKAQKEISDGIVELIKYKALGTLDDLAALVQAARAGRICKVGDDVFAIVELDELQKEEVGYSQTHDIYFGKIEGVSVDKNNSVWINCFYENGLRMFYEMKEFGKTVFFTYEAAEAALAAKEEQG